MKGVAHKKMIPYLYISGTMTIIAVFHYVPALSAIYRSFFLWDGFNPPVFIGPHNFLELVRDGVFLAGIRNVLILTAAWIIKVVTLPLIAAELVFALGNSRWGFFYKALFTIPIVVPRVVLILVWRFIYEPNLGVLNQLLRVLGLEFFTRTWLGSSDTALLSIVLFAFPWVSSIQFLLFLAALDSISQDLIDAARLDGVTGFRRVMYLDLPVITGQFQVILILTIISVLQIFDEVWLLTEGGPGSATTVPGIQIYTNAFYYGRFGYAAAIGAVMFIMMLGFTMMNGLLFTRRKL